MDKIDLKGVAIGMIIGLIMVCGVFIIELNSIKVTEKEKDLVPSMLKQYNNNFNKNVQTYKKYDKDCKIYTKFTGERTYTQVEIQVIGGHPFYTLYGDADDSLLTMIHWSNVADIPFENCTNDHIPVKIH